MNRRQKDTLLIVMTMSLAVIVFSIFVWWIS